MSQIHFSGNSSFNFAGDFPITKAHYCERFLELMIDIEAQLPTRRFVNELMDDKHIVVHSKLSTLYSRPEGKLFVQVRNEHFQ